MPKEIIKFDVDENIYFDFFFIAEDDIFKARMIERNSERLIIVSELYDIDVVELTFSLFESYRNYVRLEYER